MSEGKVTLTCGHINEPSVGIWEPETDRHGNSCRSYSAYCPACAEEATLVMVERIEELEAEVELLKKKEVEEVMWRECHIEELEVEVKEAYQRGYAQAVEDAVGKATKLAEAIQGDADAVRNTHPQFADDRSEYADDVRDLAKAIRALAEQEKNDE